nr:ATP-binding cassette domain-containing protein [Acinetobacter boissieri]
MNHLLGLEKVEQGKLFYKNIEITEKFSKNIFKEIAFVGQKNTLFNGTLRDNLIYNTNYVYTDEDLIFYIKELFLESTLNNYNIDLNTQIDEIYKKFSGGECQRLNMIRALLRKPTLLILDEPTSALDEQTAKKMLDFINSHVSSIILVTHAKYCIEWVDEIIDLNNLLTSE